MTKLASILTVVSLSLVTNVLYPQIAQARQTIGCAAMSCDVCPTERGASYSTFMRKWCITCCGYWIAPRPYNRKLKHERTQP